MKPDAPQPRRHFKGVWIPRAIWEHSQLTWLQKCLVAEIDSLSAPEAPCIASNEYLGQMFDVTPERIANMLSELRKLNVLESIPFDGRLRKLRVAYPLHGNREEPFTETVRSPSRKPGRALHGNRESLNRDIEEVLVEGTSPTPRAKFKRPTEEEVSAYAVEIGLSGVEAEKFFDHFSSNGWLVSGRAPMKDWQAALRNWQRNSIKYAHQNQNNGHYQNGSTHPSKGPQVYRNATKQPTAAEVLARRKREANQLPEA